MNLDFKVMGLTSSCLQCFISKDNDSTIKLAEIDHKTNKSKKQAKPNNKMVERRHLKVFLKNLSRLPDRRNNNNNQDRMFVIEKSENISPTSSFTSIKYPVISNSFYNKNSILASTNKQGNLENDSDNDFENFESSQFNSPEFYLVGVCTTISDQETHKTNVHEQTSNRDNNFDKQASCFNQVNQINIDGFEWDLV